MERLWSPWRSQYIQSFSDNTSGNGCVFCDAWEAADDDERYLVWRHEHCFALLNLYPYNSGHLMIIPAQHTGSFQDLPETTYIEMMLRLREWTGVIGTVLCAQGFNIGSNLGRVGGAGIDQHVHMHIVPRWNGDVNFMPVIGDTKVISESLHDTMIRLRKGYQSLKNEHI